MKSVIATEQIERYFDCPYCGQTISDEGTAQNVNTINAKDIVICPNCMKSSYVKEVK